MKNTCTLLVTLALSLVANGSLRAESVHQTLAGEAAMTPSGAPALKEKLIEVKEAPSGEKIARPVGSLPQWGFVNYWFGIPSPAGESIIRAEIFVDETETAPYAFYIKRDSGDPIVKKIEIPADAAKNTFVTIDIPVDHNQEWNGLGLKKIAASQNPGPWIKSITIVKP